MTRLKNIGNLNQRGKMQKMSLTTRTHSSTVFKFCQAKMESTVPDYTKYTDESFKQHIAEVNTALTEYIEAMEATKLRAGLTLVQHISSYAFPIASFLHSSLTHQSRQQTPARQQTRQPTLFRRAIALCRRHRRSFEPPASPRKRLVSLHAQDSRVHLPAAWAGR